MVTNAAGFLLAEVDESICTSCGKCLRICPGNPDITPAMNSRDIFHGKCLSGYIGHALNPHIRQKSQSGGIVTALLCYLLERKLVEGTVINTFNKDNNRPRAVLASSVEEIINGQGSLYAQSSVVKTILENQDKNIAAVVLGCQAESLQHLAKVRGNGLPSYVIGLFCSGQYSGKYIDEILHISGCKKEQVTGFRFKDKDAGGWPGNLKIYSSGKDYVLNQSIRHRLKKVYENYRCLLCYNQMNIYSDIAVGDPWGVDKFDNLKGNTVVIARTEKGEALIADAVRDNIISVEEIPAGQIIDGQTVDGRLKTRFFTAMQVTGNKGLMQPYDIKKFNGIAYRKPSMLKRLEIKRQLDYTRRIYRIKSIHMVNFLIRSRKLELMLNKLVIKMVRPFLKILKLTA